MHDGGRHVENVISIYKQRSASSKLLLLQRYHEYRMKLEDSVIQHVTNVQKLTSQLKDAGHEMNKTDVMAKILGSLPPKYSTLAMVWDRCRWPIKKSEYY